jgi:hypothetical protein
MLPLPICPLVGQSIFGQNISLGFMGLLSVGAKSLPVNLIFVKTYPKPRLSGVVPWILVSPFFLYFVGTSLVGRTYT